MNDREVVWMEPECRTRHRILLRPAPHIRACCGRLSLRCDPRKPHLASAPVAHCRSIRRERSKPYLRVGHGNTLDGGVLRAPQAANRRSNDHRSFAEEILRRGQRGKSVPIDPVKITVEPGVSYLPSPIKLDGHAAGVVAKAVNGNCSARRTSYEANSAQLAVGP